MMSKVWEAIKKFFSEEIPRDESAENAVIVLSSTESMLPVIVTTSRAVDEANRKD